MKSSTLLATWVATVLTVYGIETSRLADFLDQPIRVATVLTVYGIETPRQTMEQKQLH